MPDSRLSDLDVEVICTLADTSTIGQAIDVIDAWELTSKRNSSISRIDFNLSVRRLRKLGLIEDNGYGIDLITEQGWQAVEATIAAKNSLPQEAEEG